MVNDQTTKSLDNGLSEHARRILCHVWDPIGLGAALPDDEYDSYLPDVIKLVRDLAAFEAEIAAHLLKIETEMMSLPPGPERAIRAARALLGLRDVYTRNGATSLVKQCVSPDGRRCLLVFQRPDVLYTYEHMALQHENDENGAWSWWADAGEGVPGLFASAEAAEEDARGSIDWMR